MKIDGNLPIARFAAELPGAMAIFESLGLDYAWNDRPLADLTHHLVEQHHRFVREELARIAIRPADLCSLTVEELATLEAHLHEYILLENCILFPRAAALEQAMAPAAPSHVLP